MCLIEILRDYAKVLKIQYSFRDSKAYRGLEVLVENQGHTI